jgi:flavin reductase (DIM6/NTAB) family NADH-FMN oxidoreductase RutF
VAFSGVAAHHPPTITISLQPHRYSLKGIKQNMTFSANIPSVAQLKEADYCGLVSGSITDKAADCGFKIFYGGLNTAPLIEQCPVNHVCQVLHILSLGSHELIIGKIIETYISEDSITNGKLDIDKARPVISIPGAKYCIIGDQAGKSFSMGITVNPAKVKENRKNYREPIPSPD